MDDSQGRLLIVEDDSALRRSLRTTLDILGFDVGEASNGEDGLVHLRMVNDEAGLAISYAGRLCALRGSGFGNERASLRVLIGQIRKKLEDDAANPLYILTDSYIGYRFREP